MPNATDLLESLEEPLAPVEEAIRSHRVLAALAAGEVPKERLRAVAGEQRRILASDRRSFAQLAARFPAAPAGDFFLGMAQGEGQALGLLDGYIAWLGVDEAWLRAYEPDPRAQAYPAYVAWLALNGSSSAVALAFQANLAAWGHNCGAVAGALRDAYGAGDEAVAFFEFFATPPPDFEAGTLAVVQAGLDAGEDPTEARHAARLLQAYELLFWDALG
jgi:TENA/THI-4/PQQC family protein